MSENHTNAAVQVMREAIEEIENMGLTLDAIMPVTAEKAALVMLTLEFVRSDAPNGCVYRVNGEDDGVAFDVIVNIYHANVDDPATQVLRQLEEFGNFHPRALKLLTKMKEFLVVAHDEPYYWDVYNMIRDSEMIRDTWTEEDEARFQGKWIEEAMNCLADKTEDYEFARYYATELWRSATSRNILSPEKPSIVVDNDASYWGE